MEFSDSLKCIHLCLVFVSICQSLLNIIHFGFEFDLSTILFINIRPVFDLVKLFGHPDVDRHNGIELLGYGLSSSFVKGIGHRFPLLPLPMSAAAQAHIQMEWAHLSCCYTIRITLCIY